jgi:hypothetical protein|tara:strand:+ start:234 stop:476 length:243 start_codon:yes stop_codon:yes gene_type:complete
MNTLLVKVDTLNKQLVMLDASAQALEAIHKLLSLCPPEQNVNANALGQLLHVVHKDIDTHLSTLDATHQLISDHIQEQSK